MSHPLHREIGTFLDDIELPEGCELLLAPECAPLRHGDKKHNLPLFCSPQKSNDREYCNVDAMVVKGGRVRFLLEIEETGLTPTKICGKFLTSALSSHFIYKTVTPMDVAVTFVQVMNSEHLKDSTRKITQGQFLESSIRNLLSMGSSAIPVYRLFYCRGTVGFQSDEDTQAELRNLFLSACGCPLMVNTDVTRCRNIGSRDSAANRP